MPSALSSSARPARFVIGLSLAISASAPSSSARTDDPPSDVAGFDRIVAVSEELPAAVAALDEPQG